jgi:hypothetical protein
VGAKLSDDLLHRQRRVVIELGQNDILGLYGLPDLIGEIVEDLPGGEWRRIKKAIGYHAILVNGEVTFADGECTGATPGKLLRSGQAEPIAKERAA